MSACVPYIAELAYHADPGRYFAHLADSEWSQLLDGHALASGPGGRYAIMVAEPLERLVATPTGLRVELSGSTLALAGDPLTLLRARLARFGAGLLAPPSELPFAGGALGYLAYDLGRRFEPLPAQAEDDLGLPDLMVGLYDWALLLDHAERRACLVGLSPDPERRAEYARRVAQLVAPPPPPGAPLVAREAVHSNLTREAYGVAFRRVQHYIREGDCYQVNLAQRFTVAVSGSGWAGYHPLREASRAPFGAYLKLPGVEVLSLSPERFLSVDAQGEVVTMPIKGTRPRREAPEADAQEAAALAQSPKDRAENLMIVDLLRNDLGRCCRPGSIRVERLFEVQSFPHVHHLVSRIHGRLATGLDPLDLLRASFPGGSITGAPKVRAMQVIDALEPHRRALYCGSIFYLGVDGRLDSSIAIRTLLLKDGRLYYWAGGGLVADSDEEAEYRETLHKAAPFLDRFPRS